MLSTPAVVRLQFIMATERNSAAAAEDMVVVLIWASQKSSLRMQSAVKHAQTSFSSPDSVMCSLYLELKQPQDRGKCLFS